MMGFAAEGPYFKVPAWLMMYMFICGLTTILILNKFFSLGVFIHVISECYQVTKSMWVEDSGKLVLGNKCSNSEIRKGIGLPYLDEENVLMGCDVSW